MPSDLQGLTLIPYEMVTFDIAARIAPVCDRCGNRKRLGVRTFTSDK